MFEQRVTRLGHQHDVARIAQQLPQKPVRLARTGCQHDMRRIDHDAPPSKVRRHRCAGVRQPKRRWLIGRGASGAQRGGDLGCRVREPHLGRVVTVRSSSGVPARLRASTRRASAFSGWSQSSRRQRPHRRPSSVALQPLRPARAMPSALRPVPHRRQHPAGVPVSAPHSHFQLSAHVAPCPQVSSSAPPAPASVRCSHSRVSSERRTRDAHRRCEGSVVRSDDGPAFLRCGSTTS